MANRSYLYSLSNRPTSYADRPETISGLSEWPYYVPFMYRLLMSGDPQLCASLVSDGFDIDEPEQKTRLYAISSHFDTGLERVKRFAEIVRATTALLPDAEPPPANTPQPASFLNRLKLVFASQKESPQPSTTPSSAPTDELLANLDETITFLETHRDTYLLLETIELDTMSESEEAELKACVEQEMARCIQAGAAVDALPANIEEAAWQLRLATRLSGAAPFDAFFRLRLDNDCDSTHTEETEYPLGLVWDDTLYFDLMNRSEFEAQQR
ncbi:hypothetical protein [Achromobacter pestifer]|uniref:DUF7822 domain-containing protein n=1 Tax=Achromobacter pestifer TaxID=1353889 RepID=A0A6S6YU64_9BURK|nr:hypothetical protein [Achromobacter pestifer]CAB3642924.1 hypothetical protein LMG3431_02276 [Achromobacter pestifer]